MDGRHSLQRALGLVFAFTFWVAGSGCAPTKTLQREYSPEELFTSACGIGKEIPAVSGNASLKVSSTHVKGRFPAMIKASSLGDLALDVMNPFGGTEASIVIEGDHYVVKRPGHKKSETEGTGSWNGIPLRWISDLFLGKIPCPSGSKLSEIPNLKVKQDEAAQLILRIAGQQNQEPQEFRFHFHDRDGKPWPDSLQWIGGRSSSQAIDFTFEDPEKATSIPLKWEAKSKQGSIQVRWRERNTNTGT